MQRFLALAVLCSLVLAACQAAAPIRVTVAADDKLIALASAGRVPVSILRRAGIPLVVGDLVTNRGYEVDTNAAIPEGQPIRIQVRRPIQALINGQPVSTTASTVGEALNQAGFDLYAADLLDPPADSPVSAGLAIHFTPSRTASIYLDGRNVPVRTVAGGVGAGLAEAGNPLIGLDIATPAESEPFRDTGQTRLTRVAESLLLEQEPIPFEITSQDSPDVELGLEQVLEPGFPGVAVTRTRIRLEDQVEVARREESQAIVRPPKNRLVLRGTKIVEKTASVDGISLEYWHSLQMYATVYSPCNSGTAGGSCSSGTASGLPAGKGVVAVDPALFAVLNGQRLYIPGYGHAVVGDIGGGYIIEQSLGISRYRWIDLGFDDNNIQDMTGWVTVYFLPPAPASIPAILQ